MADNLSQQFTSNTATNYALRVFLYKILKCLSSNLCQMVLVKSYRVPDEMDQFLVHQNLVKRGTLINLDKKILPHFCHLRTNSTVDRTTQT